MAFSRLLPGFTAFLALSASQGAQAKEKNPGVRAWISGSQTYIRIRPDVSTPPVAKVAAHTPVHVWGKKNGWYRVETSDHTFGWVFHAYINSPDIHKVEELSDAKARQASDRTAHQTMYGSPELLQKYYAQYGDKGALKGLAKHGIVPVAAAKPAAPKPQLVKTPAKAPAAADTPAARLAVASAPAKAALAKGVPAKAVSAKTGEAQAAGASLIPVETSRKSIAGQNQEMASRSMSRPEALHRMNGVEWATMANIGASTPPFAELPRTGVKAENRPEARVDASSIARAPQGAASQAKTLARAAATEAMRSEPVTAAQPAQAAPAQAATGTRTATAPQAPLTAPESVLEGVPVMPMAPVAVALPSQSTPAVPAAPAVVKSAPPATPAKPVTQVAAKAVTQAPAKAPAKAPARPLTAKEKQREALRRSMGMNPAAARPAPVAPVSPQDLLRAREEYLAQRRERYGEPEKPGAGNAQVQPSSTAAQASAKVQTMSYRGSSAGAVYRGGSPRDMAQAKQGANMAKQALAYRGMPYRRGAASPSRGFDCSGLVYFLLRQRGYNPPRTAAGYSNYGESVARGQWKPGDLILFSNTYKRGISHIGVYMGDGKFVHAATAGTGVRVDSLTSGYYAGKYHSARRVK